MDRLGGPFPTLRRGVFGRRRFRHRTRDAGLLQRRPGCRRASGATEGDSGPVRRPAGRANGMSRLARGAALRARKVDPIEAGERRRRREGSQLCAWPSASDWTPPSRRRRVGEGRPCGGAGGVLGPAPVLPPAPARRALDLVTRPWVLGWWCGPPARRRGAGTFPSKGRARGGKGRALRGAPPQ